MGQFSNNQELGNGYCLECNQANLFAANLPAGGSTIEGIVGGQATQVSLGGTISPLINTREGTTGEFSLRINGQNKVIAQDLSQFIVTKPEDVGAYFECRPLKNAGDSPNSDDESVVVLAVDESMKASAPAEGEVNIETADEFTVAWLAIAVARALNIVDRSIGTEQLKNNTNGNIDFTLTGTNTVPLALELGDMLRRGKNREFLREAFKHNTKIAKIWTNANGNLMVSFRGSAGLRPFLSGTSYLARNTKLSVISTAVKNSRNWAGTVRSAGKGIPVISYIIVGAIDVAQWLSLPEAEQDFSDLIATLFVDITKIAVSAIAGTLAAAGVIAAAAAGLVTAPVWAAVAVGIGAAVAVGVLLDVVDNAFGLTEQVEKLADKAGNGAQAFFAWIQDGYNSTLDSFKNTMDNFGRQIKWFESLSDIDQYNLMRRGFGGR